MRKRTEASEIKMSNSTGDLNSVEIWVILSIKTRIPMILPLICWFFPAAAAEDGHQIVRDTNRSAVTCKYHQLLAGLMPFPARWNVMVSCL